MALLASILIALITIFYFCFLVLEMFLWDKPQGLKTFGHTLEVGSGGAWPDLPHFVGPKHV